MKKKKLNLSRVDVQVSVLTASLVFVTSFCIFYICFAVTYNDMINALTERVNSIYSYVDTQLDKTTFFDIDSKQDIKEDNYKRAKATLENVRHVTGVKYLYTAKRSPKGELVYVVDGLDYGASDFRYPGDLIEDEMQGYLSSALEDERIMPRRIQNTQWGKIFIAYMPIHDDDNKVLGVVGIEFEAVNQYNTYTTILKLLPIFCLLICGVSVAISTFAFRRISNPSYRNLATIDRATGFKNRNSFDVEIGNLNAKKQVMGIGIISMDLNSLKAVNDTLGHDEGDKYIAFASAAMQQSAGKSITLYRIGGDEFAGIIKDADADMIKSFIESVNNIMPKWQSKINFPISVSSGGAIYREEDLCDLTNTYKRADLMMYENKKAFYDKQKYGK